MFEPKLLRAFVSIADTGNFTLAAEQLHLTQSTISQQINRLEESVGTPLLNRTKRPVQLTNAGEKLLSYARRILSLQSEAQAVLSMPAGSTSFKIGIPDDIASGEMMRTFAAFARQHPEVKLDVTTGLSPDLCQRFRQGEFDIVVVKEKHAASDCYAHFAEPLCWYQAAHTDIENSVPLPLVTFPPGALYRDTMMERADAEGKRWYIAFSSANLNNNIAAVEAGLGLSLLPVGAAMGQGVIPSPTFGYEPEITLSLYCQTADMLVTTLAESMQQVLQQRFLAIQKQLASAAMDDAGFQ